MATSSNSAGREMQAYRKADLPDETVAIHKKKKENKQSSETEFDVPTNKATAKQKTKYLPLFGKDGKIENVLQIPGRNPCQCEATKHSLISNCLNCGRIVCSQEGSGPCFTCSNLVCTREEREILRRGDKRSEQLCKKLSIGLESVGDLKGLANKLQEGLSKAIEQKNQLLEFDRNCEKRTRVIDDEADYFSVEASQWLSRDERNLLKERFEELQKLKHSRQTKVTLDFAGRKVIDDQENKDIYDVNDPLVQKIFCSQNERDTKNIENNYENYYPELQYEKPVKKSSLPKDLNTEKPKTLRIQDRELQEMSDEGICLSVRQPFASLLISGLRRFEGREWYTPHRGRLWIASGNRQATTKEIREAESVVKHLNADSRVILPEQYPIGSLLGCVNLIDCISQEQYREEHPDGECEDTYVWLCDDPKELLIKFPIKGKPKLFKLEDQIHQAAQKTIKTKF